MICWLVWLLLFRLVPHCPSRAGAFPQFFCNGGSLLYGPQLVLPAFSGETTQYPTEKGQKLCFSHTSLRPCSASHLWSSWGISVKLPARGYSWSSSWGRKHGREGGGWDTSPGVTAVPASPGCRQLGQRTPCWRSPSLQALGQRTAGRLTELSREAWLSRAPPGEKWGPPQTAKNNWADGCSKVLFRSRPAALTEAGFNVFLASRSSYSSKERNIPWSRRMGPSGLRLCKGASDTIHFLSPSLSLLFFF